MALKESSLSQVCRSIATFLGGRLEAAQNNILVRVGSPSDAAPKEGDGDHRINLFFYRFEPTAFEAAVTPADTWRLRLHCLITAFGVLEDQVSAGENDLRLLGEVIRVFHETPILDAFSVSRGNGGGNETVRARVVFQPLSVDQINHLWSTQGDLAYRPSVAYEIGLAPVLPLEEAAESPLVGAIGFDVQGETEDRRAPFTGSIEHPAVPHFLVDTESPDWAPRICFVDAATCAESLAFAAPTGFAPEVWLAGEPGVEVELRWEVWEEGGGWSVHVPAGGPQKALISSRSIDPEAAGAATTTPSPLPFNDKAGQLLLYAVRSFKRPADGVELELRSNPLLVSLFEVVQ